ncbi:hypothetical protein FCIRC_2923 [Fusarium circinatum]|uniref:Peptidase S1 domain-containing protein n=1 Tax=Fusarium circinatum TaxID=48490 RepID=A0A8H5UEA6_FUSCI|nr:hypothetical protein FCIRC_2923 [Fusarium circinatum]
MPLQEPSERESRMYYCGLPTCPKLIARSSSTPWPQPHEFVGNKKLSVATGHAIQQPWNNPRGSLQPLILATLTDIDWTAIDILRVGYEVNYKVPGRTFEGPVTMLISVSPNSTPFHRAEAVIVSCKQILARFALDDVEVEVKESIVATAASCPTTDQQVLRLESGPFNNDVDDIKFKFSLHVSEYIGTSIGVTETFKGTKGLYLQGKDSKTYALTCRHVLFPKDSIDYRHGNSDNIKQVIQPALGTTFDLLRYFPAEKFTIETSERLTTHPRYNIPEFQAELPKLLQKQALLDSFQAHFDHLTSAGSFGLGRVEIAPRIQLYTDDMQLCPKRIRDWALVELSQENFTTSLSDLTNKVPVTQLFRDGFKEHKDTVTHGALLPVNTSPEVKIGPDLISEAELENASVSGIADQQRLVVVKFGCSSGVTFGHSNSIRSVVRHPHPPGAATTDGIVSNHWCIVGVERKAPFSIGGDSGACIFDLRGRIGGIVTAGLAASDKPNPDGFDVTYATPMQWLLEDIARHGYDVDLPN